MAIVAENHGEPRYGYGSLGGYCEIARRRMVLSNVKGEMQEVYLVTVASSAYVSTTKDAPRVFHSDAYRSQRGGS